MTQDDGAWSKDREELPIDIVISCVLSTFLSTPTFVEHTTPMSKYPGQELSPEQLFYALNAKIFEQTRNCQSSVPGPDQQRWVST